MKIIVKKLQGGECNVEVDSTTTIADIKRKVAAELHIPIEEQKLLIAGRTLADEQRIKFYPMLKDGTKLNLVVKKPEGLFEAGVRYFKSVGCSEREANESAHKLLNIVKQKVYAMSWDDLDRLCHELLLEERGELPLQQADHDTDCEDSFGL